MNKWKEFEGVNNFEGRNKIIAETIIQNELGGKSNGYTLDHAGTLNSGWSFGGNQMDLGVEKNGTPRNSNGRAIFKDIIIQQEGESFYNSIKDIVYTNGNWLDIPRTSDIRMKINEVFKVELDKSIFHVDKVISDNDFGIDLNQNSAADLINLNETTYILNSDLKGNNKLDHNISSDNSEAVIKIADIVVNLSEKIIKGTAKNDILNGENGNDNIRGKAGNDKLNGGSGADILFGWSGKDSFIFDNISDSTNQNLDVIMDFIHGEDHIDLSAINSINSINDLTITHDGISTIIDDKNSDFAVKLSGVHLLAADDFYFHN